MTDLGRAGGPYIRLTLLWLRSTITILSKATRTPHHPPPRKTIIHVVPAAGNRPDAVPPASLGLGGRQGEIASPLPSPYPLAISPIHKLPVVGCLRVRPRLRPCSNGPLESKSLLLHPPHHLGLHARRHPHARPHQVQHQAPPGLPGHLRYPTLSCPGVVHDDVLYTRELTTVG